MTTPKTWIAYDLHLGKLIITRTGNDLHIERRYVFLDQSGHQLASIAAGRLVKQLPLAALPANIRTALSQIDTWTKQQALNQEDMA